MTATTELSLEQRLRRIEDERAIELLKYRYTRYCDDGYDTEGIVSLFARDGHWLCTPASHGGEAVGHEQMRELFPALAAAIPWAAHYASAPTIAVAADGQSATGQFYFFGLLTADAGDGQAPEAMVLSGVYRDTFAKIDGEWVFSELVAELGQAARWTEGWVREPWGGQG